MKATQKYQLFKSAVFFCQEKWQNWYLHRFKKQNKTQFFLVILITVLFEDLRFVGVGISVSITFFLSNKITRRPFLFFTVRGGILIFFLLIEETTLRYDTVWDWKQKLWPKHDIFVFVICGSENYFTGCHYFFLFTL